jgi:hypothetical protein
MERMNEKAEVKYLYQEVDWIGERWANRGW